MKEPGYYSGTWRGRKRAGIECRSVAAVEFTILAGVQDVKTGHPIQHREPQNDRRQIEPSSYGNPCAERGSTQAEPEEEVGHPGESFGVGVEKQNP